MLNSNISQIIVSVVVTSGFILVLSLWLLKPVSISAESATILNVLVGTLAAAFTQVVNYWLGSSAGSRAKDAIIGNMTETRNGK